jgi:hypothetical protein
MNHSPKRDLSFRTPNQVFSGLNPPVYLPEFKDEMVTLPSEKIVYLEDLQNQVMLEKVQNYLIMSKNQEGKFKLGEFVMSRDPVGVTANKIKGPFKVVRVGIKSAVEIEDLVTGVRYKRNGRHLFKIYIRESDMEKFVGSERTMLESVREEDLEGQIASPLDNISIKFPEASAEQNGYKLRSGRK